MGLFEVGQTLNSVGTAIGAVSSAARTVSNVTNALSNLGSAGGVASALRSLNLPAGGEAIGDILGAIASFGGDEYANDWRVRLTLSNWSSFKNSPVLTPLAQAGGLVFPYTPDIKIEHGTMYTPISTTHTNYSHQAFKSSDPGAITITAPMNIEDPNQGLYWIAAVHYLRSLTKMFMGDDPKAGNPPPIVMLNGYGNYVFKNVPVVVKSFNVQLDGKCDYIGVDVVGSSSGEMQGLTDSIGGLADTIGNFIPGLSGITGLVSGIAGGVGQVAGMLGTFGLSGAVSGGVTHVPTRSSFGITLIPVYSRNSARKFSLDRFVSGGYLDTGYI